jgi:hypothetical protein
MSKDNTTPVENTEVEQPTSEATATPVREPAGQIRTPKAKGRSILELCEANPNSMTQNEAIRYIKYLREECEKMARKVTTIENNTKGAFAKASYFEKAMESIDSVHSKQHAFIESSIRNLLTSLEHISTSTACNVNAIKKGVVSHGN